MLPDWQLPPGVSRGLCEYVHDPEIARQYDARLADTPLLQFDLDFVRQHCLHPGRLIDLGCGTGRLALVMAGSGFQVLAVDLSEEMLKIVGEKARHTGLALDRLKANLVDLRGLADGSFDHAACLFQTLGMIRGRSACEQVIRHVHRLLRPDGVFILHAHNLWFHLSTRYGRRLLARNIWNWLRGREPLGDFMMPHQGIGAMFMHLFTRKEVLRLLRQQGFVIEEIRPISNGRTGAICCPWLFGSLRSYGYLIAARKI